MQIYNISRKKHEKNGTFFSGIGDGGSGMEDRGWRIGDGESGMEVQRERGKVGKLLNILRFSAFSGKNILRFSAKGWGWSFHAALQKNWKNSKAPTAVGWMPCGSLHFRDFESSIVRSITRKLCIVHYALSVVRNYQMMVRSFSSSHILAPGLMSKALKKVSMLRRVALTRYSPSECGSLLVCM